MAKGILGTKVGMTQIFNETAKLVPVTIVQCEPNVVLQKKTIEKDGYVAVQLGYKNKRDRLANKPEHGHIAKANTSPKRYIREITGNELSNFEVGQEIKVNIFADGEVIDVTAVSKGKGFQGSIKRHGYSRGPMTHGSRYHRGPGSLGTIDPAHVRKGTKLPGHMGSETVTIQNLMVVKVDLDNNVLLIKGNVPGPKGALVFVKRGVKTEPIQPLNPDDFQPEPETIEEKPQEEKPQEEKPQEEKPQEENNSSDDSKESSE